MPASCYSNCFGKVAADDTHCSALTPQATCDADTKCKWTQITFESNKMCNDANYKLGETNNKSLEECKEICRTTTDCDAFGFELNSS